MNLEDIARIAYAANRAVRQVLGEVAIPEWDEAQEHIRQSILNGVRYRLDRPEASDAENHENWRLMKLSQGWRLGSPEDIANKVHPNLVMYQDLPETQKAKDSLFGGIVRALRPFLQAEPTDATAALKQPNWNAAGSQT